MRSLLPIGALFLAALPASLQARDYGQRGAVFPAVSYTHLTLPTKRIV